MNKVLTILTLLMSSTLAFATTLQTVLDRGELICGVSGTSSGMSFVDENGRYTGLDVEVCRAIALAVLKDKDAVEFRELGTKVRFKALMAGEVDVLSRNSTWNFQRDTYSIDFVGVNFYDGQTFMARKNSGIRTLETIPKNASICVEKHTTTEKNLINYFKKIHHPIKVNSHESRQFAIERFFQGDCDLFTGDTTDLLSIRATYAPNSKDYILLDEKISKEPLGPAVRDGDSQWSNIVRWALFGLVEAEEKGISSNNIDQLLNSKDPGIQYLLGVTPGIGQGVGLDDKWFYRMIKGVGNYAEIYDKNFGPNTKTHMERGLNALWKDGGVMYSPPLK